MLKMLASTNFWVGLNISSPASASPPNKKIASGLVKATAFIIACPIAYYAMNKWLENFAYKTEISWWIFALSGFIAMFIALFTISWQSWRAASKNPVEALRYE